MSSLTYFERVKPVWDELAELLSKARRAGPRGLTAEELARLDRLYRLTTIHLAQARLRTTNRHLIERLDRLVAEAHSFIYVSPKKNPLERLLRFYCLGFGQAVARTWRFQAAAILLFFVGAVASHQASLRDDLPPYALLGAEEVRLPGSSVAQLQNVLRSGRDGAAEDRFAFASFLFTHNTRVGLTAFASGVLAGVPTVFLMVYFGAHVGAFTAVHYRHGIVEEMWAWILPHGVTEILAALLCGGAGLMLGMALLRPGDLSRARSLTLAGREAIRIVMGVLPMFLVAGIIESYVRQSHLSTESRLWFAGLSGAFWVAYFGVGAWVEWREGRRGSFLRVRGGRSLRRDL
jgi:uncharacterized membrane protein SpoIIM required for sporulation